VQRYDVARDLAALVPLELGREVALTGSVARGVADDDSDIEFVAWVDTMPSAEERVGWLEHIGASEIGEPHTSSDGTVWEWSRFRGLWLETGWQPIARHEENLRAMMEAKVTDHRVLQTASAVVHALPLRTNGALARWQAELSYYPEALAPLLIADASRRWRHALAYWSLERRGDRVAATERLLADVHSILRIVFAVNRVWEPGWKWARWTTRDLVLKPARLMDRIDEVLTCTELESSLQSCAELAAETLSLVPPEIDVTDARAAVARSLRERSP
jgi:hypothetical protein